MRLHSFINGGGGVFIAWVIMAALVFLACLFDLLCRLYCFKREEHDEEIAYECLSSERKLILDNLRSRAILRHLRRFTLSLTFEDMLKRPDNSESSSALGDDPGGKEEGTLNGIDIEMGDDAPANTVDGNTLSAGGIRDSDFTYVLIPPPGHAIAVSNVERVGDCSTDNETKKMRSVLFLKAPYRSSKVGHDGIIEENEQNEEKAPCTPDEPSPTDPDNDIVTENRAVPIICAVCLSMYKISERVCWSSNSECTHVFHEDCMTKWLVSLGKTHSKKRLYNKNPSEEKLLDFDLSCPCCRQDFISSSLIVKKNETDDSDEAFDANPRILRT